MQARENVPSALASRYLQVLRFWPFLNYHARGAVEPEHRARHRRRAGLRERMRHLGP